MTWSAEIEAGFGDLLADVGEEVQWTDEFGVLHLNADGTLPRALFKRPGQLVLSDMQISDEYAIEYRVADFGTIVHNDLITVTGMRFRVRSDPMQGDDPVLKVALLTRLDGNC